MPNELTNKQCDLLQKRYRGLRVSMTTCYPDPWFAIRSTDREDGTYGSSRQDALTKWCKIWSPEWTPPTEDAAHQKVQIAIGWDRAGRYGEIIGASVHMGGLWWTPVEWDDEEDPDWHKTAGLTRIDPDKPTREETVKDTELRSAVELLREIVQANICGIATMALALDNARDFLKAKGTAESPDLGGDEGSEANHVD